MQLFSDGFKVVRGRSKECVGNYITIPFPSKEGRKGERKITTNLLCVPEDYRVALRTETLWIGKREEIERESDVKKDNSFMWRKIMYPSIFAF